jgi:hypothetical protein
VSFGINGHDVFCSGWVSLTKLCRPTVLSLLSSVVLAKVYAHFYFSPTFSSLAPFFFKKVLSHTHARQQGVQRSIVTDSAPESA